MQDFLNEISTFLKDELRFIPDCGGDYCDLVTDPYWAMGYCQHKGYCKFFYQLEKRRDELLAELAKVQGR